MTDDNIRNDSGFDRRKFLAGLGAGAATGLAGCTDGGGGDSDGTATTTEGEMMTTTEGGGGMTTTEGGGDETTTEGGGEPQQGGRPTIGLITPPATLNPMQAGSVYSFYVIDRVMGYGTTTNPATDNPPEFAPWQIEDWTLNTGNAGSPGDGPALENVKLREDLTFTDGEDVTAEDLQYTMLRFRLENPGESLNGAAHQAIADGDNVPGEVEGANKDLGSGVEIVDDYTVNVYMSSPEQRWLTNILGWPILPKHIWTGVDDITQYSPRQTEAGLVGSGAFELADFSWENWFELDTRDGYNIPAADYVPWIDDGAPFIDGIRFEVFGSQNAMEQAVLNGDIDAGFSAGGFTVNTAVQAENDENITVHQSQEVGYNHISYNMRRVPFDDPAFRQFLNKIFDKTWVIENPYSNIGAVQGDYVVIPELGAWRPPAPQDIAGQEFKADGVDDIVEGGADSVTIPDLSFPGDPGSFNMTQEQVNAARDFLINNPRAKHDYSFGEAQTGQTRAPDGQELYVNGQHITEAHTDNDGNGGQGTIEFSFQPPQEDIYQARYGNQMVGAMKLVGIPAEPLVKTINAQIPTIYNQEDFDMFAMGWGLGVSVTHLASLYSSEGADVDSTSDTGAFNPMAYTDADDLIFRDLELMDFEDRFPIVQQICAQIYADAPTNITDVAQLLEPTQNTFTGWVGGLGTTINEDSFLNLRQSQ